MTNLIGQTVSHYRILDHPNVPGVDNIGETGDVKIQLPRVSIPGLGT